MNPTARIDPPDPSKVQANYGSSAYLPIDPIPVVLLSGGKRVTPEAAKALLQNALPNGSMRMAMFTWTAEGGISFGPASANVSAGRYLVIVDYIQATTLPLVAVWGPPSEVDQSDSGSSPPDRRQASVEVKPADPGKRTPAGSTWIPVYAGVGVRMYINLTVTKGGVNLASLTSIGFHASAGDIAGTMTYQTLGCPGKPVSSAIPAPTEISEASIQAALMSIGTVRERLFNSDTVWVPQAIAISNTLGGDGRMIQQFIAAMLAEPLTLELNPVVDAAKNAQSAQTSAPSSEAGRTEGEAKKGN
ncbi:MAG: hypothetical protein U0636_00125 [Phycisphaerales bacterium]